MEVVQIVKEVVEEVKQPAEGETAAVLPALIDDLYHFTNTNQSFTEARLVTTTIKVSI